MSFSQNIIKILVMSAALAFWELFGKGMYSGWVISQGHTMGFGETMLGYFVVLTVGYILAFVITKKYGGSD